MAQAKRVSNLQTREAHIHTPRDTAIYSDFDQLVPLESSRRAYAPEPRGARSLKLSGSNSVRFGQYVVRVSKVSVQRKINREESPYPSPLFLSLQS